jgi:hypothetical protein
VGDVRTVRCPKGLNQGEPVGSATPARVPKERKTSRQRQTVEVRNVVASGSTDGDNSNRTRWSAAFEQVTSGSPILARIK